MPTLTLHPTNLSGCGGHSGKKREKGTMSSEVISKISKDSNPDAHILEPTFFSLWPLERVDHWVFKNKAEIFWRRRQ